MLRFLFHCLLASHCSPLFGQQWQYAGDTVACDFAAANPYVAVNKYNEAYLLYRDMSSAPEQTSVKKFDGTNWLNVGSHPISNGTLPPCMAFDTAGLPYVAVVITNGNLNVKRFDGANWVAVGAANFTPGQVTSVTMKIAPDNTPYVAFRDFAHNQNMSVMKFDGTSWVYVGSPGFSPNHPQPYHGAWRPSLAFDQLGTPYIAYIDITSGWRLSVMKFDGTSWVYVGTPNISGGGAGEPTLVIDNQGSPIVGYTDGNAQVKKFNGTSWVTVGQPAFATNIDYPMMTIDNNNRLYLVYTTNRKLNVMELHGGNWIPCGNADFHPNAYFTTIAVDSNGENIYVGLHDGTDRHYPGGGLYNIASVMKLDRTNGINPNSTTQGSFDAFPNPTDSKVRINYTGKEAEKAVLRVTSASEQIVYKEDFTGSYTKEIDLSPFSKGLYFIEIRSGKNIVKRKVLLQ